MWFWETNKKSNAYYSSSVEWDMHIFQVGSRQLCASKTQCIGTMCILCNQYLCMLVKQLADQEPIYLFIT